jgi:LmbE family N-acetylglucosaminyl deacetylase
LTAVLDKMSPHAVAVPLGIFHDDHVLTSDAALDALSRRAPPIWLIYADAIYRRVPDLVDRRLQQIGELGLTLRELDVPGSGVGDLKRRAVACYQSQVRALERSWDGGVSDAFEPERYWQVVHAEATPSGSDRLPVEERDGDDA